MGNRDRPDTPDALVPEFPLTSKSKLHDTLTKDLREDPMSATKVREAMTILEEMTEGTTVLHRYQPKVARVSWMRRVLGWFRRS